MAASKIRSNFLGHNKDCIVVGVLVGASLFRELPFDFEMAMKA